MPICRCIYWWRWTVRVFIHYGENDKLYHTQLLLSMVVSFQGCLKLAQYPERGCSMQHIFLQRLSTHYHCLKFYLASTGVTWHSMKGSNYAFQCVTLAFSETIFLIPFHWIGETEFKSRSLCCSSIFSMHTQLSHPSQTFLSNLYILNIYINGMLSTNSIKRRILLDYVFSKW